MVIFQFDGMLYEYVNNFVWWYMNMLINRFVTLFCINFMLIYVLKFCRNASTQVYFPPLLPHLLCLYTFSMFIFFLILAVCITVMIVILLIQHVCHWGAGGALARVWRVVSHSVRQHKPVTDVHTKLQETLPLLLNMFPIACVCVRVCVACLSTSSASYASVPVATAHSLTHTADSCEYTRDPTYTVHSH